MALIRHGSIEDFAAPRTPREALENVSGSLASVWLELTPKCNLQCTHCYSDSTPSRPLEGEMQIHDWLNALREAYDLGRRSVQFIGGEPTLHKGLPHMIEFARSKGYSSVEVLTNGTHLTEELKTSFVRHKVSLAFSVYADTSDIHDLITMSHGSFSKTISALKWALASGLDVRASIVEMQANAECVERTREMLREAGVQSIRVDRIRGIGRGANERSLESPIQELCGRCLDRQISIGWDGHVYPCVFAHSWPIGHMASGGLSEAVASDEARSFRDSLANVTRKAGCSPDYDPPQCQPKRPICGPDLPTPPCQPDRPQPCSPDCVPSACTPQIV